MDRFRMKAECEEIRKVLEVEGMVKGEVRI